MLPVKLSGNVSEVVHRSVAVLSFRRWLRFLAFSYPHPAVKANKKGRGFEKPM
jgi:hypothetical protein